ncbi:MAG: VOC family protein [Chloroflexota bacterium]
MKHTPDHIIYFAPSLENAYDQFEKLLGVRPVFGGQHPGRGSHNALLSLGDSCYLEIIAPDPAQPTPPAPRSFGMDSLAEAKLLHWAVTSTNIDASVSAAKAAGYDPGMVHDGSRSRSDGVLMEWKLTRRPEAVAGTNPPGDWLVPFLIDWGETLHPAQNNPAGCTLISLEATHPDPDSVQTMLDALGVECIVKQGDAVQLIASIDTPNGRVELR